MPKGKQQYDDDAMAGGVPSYDEVPPAGRDEEVALATLESSELDDLGLQAPMQLTPASAATTVEIARAQARMLLQMHAARSAPRNIPDAAKNIILECRVYKLAKVSLWAFPRGKDTIGGPSIHLARCIARHWGNISYGWMFMDSRLDSTEMRAEAWDLQTNTVAFRQWTVRHEKKAHSSLKALVDPRDIYEHLANEGSRRVRVCILDLIPSHIVERAVAEVRATLKRGDGRSIGERVSELVIAFQDLGITSDMLEEKLGHPLGAITNDEFPDLQAIYAAVKETPNAKYGIFGGSSQSSELRGLAEELLRKGKGGEQNGK